MIGSNGPCLLGIDNGLTVTKAVVFDAAGNVLSVARRRLPQLIPAPRFVERDMAGLWSSTAEAIAEALAASGRADDIAAVAATADRPAVNATAAARVMAARVREGMRLLRGRGGDPDQGGRTPRTIGSAHDRFGTASGPQVVAPVNGL